MCYDPELFDVFELIQLDSFSLWVLSVPDTTIGEGMPFNSELSKDFLDLRQDLGYCFLGATNL